MTTAHLTDPAEAVADIPDGATVLIGGFGLAGQPTELINALRLQGATDLTVVNNNAGNGDHGLAALLSTGDVRKIICFFPRQSDSWVFDKLHRTGHIELEGDSASSKACAVERGRGESRLQRTSKGGKRHRRVDRW